MEDKIDIKDLLLILKKRLLLIVTLTIVMGLSAWLYTHFIVTPMYQSSTKLLINQSKSDQTLVNSSDVQVQANIQLIDTYNEIIRSSRVLSIVSEKLNNGITTEQLNRQITISKTDNSQVVTILVKDSNPKQAAKIANVTAEVFQTEIIKIMKIDNVNILDKATINNSPVEPNTAKNTAIGILVGLIAGIGLALLLDYFDNTIKSERDIENLIGAPILGSIAEMDDSIMNKLKDSSATNNPAIRGGSLGSYKEFKN